MAKIFEVGDLVVYEKDKSQPYTIVKVGRELNSLPGNDPIVRTKYVIKKRGSNLIIDVVERNSSNPILKPYVLKQNVSGGKRRKTHRKSHRIHRRTYRRRN